jgi:Protein of unknown function (DUF2793)
MILPSSLQLLDCAIATCVEAVGADTPPAAAGPGSAYIVGTAPTGAWAGKSGHIATMSAAGWRFLAPVDGLSAVIRSNGLRAEYRSGAWQAGILRADRLEIGGEQVVSSQAAAIASPAGGATIDAEARAAIDLVLTALRNHGLIAS